MRMGHREPVRQRPVVQRVCNPFGDRPRIGTLHEGQRRLVILRERAFALDPQFDQLVMDAAAPLAGAQVKHGPRRHHAAEVLHRKLRVDGPEDRLR